jgi:hypothetical protein
MADGVVSVRQAVDGDRAIDNEVRTNDVGAEVYRQKVTGDLDQRYRCGVRTTKAGIATSSGDNTIHTPASGKKCRLYWIGLSASQDNAAENLVIVKFGAAGEAKYRWRMGNPGAFSHWEPIEGAADEALILNLANGEDVDWNITVEEVT